MKNKVVSLEEAIDLINDNDSVAIAGAGLVMYPEYLAKGIEEKFLRTGCPKNLTLIAGCGHGDWDEKGDSRFAHTGLLKRFIGTHPETNPPLRSMLSNNEIEAYNIPQGVVNHLYRSIAAKELGVISKIGIGTFCDPRLDGCKLNTKTTEEITELFNYNGEDWILYKSFPINVALIRGTTADEKGNITVEREALKMETYEIAAAARACGGKVIAQVERIAANGSLNPKSVLIPGVLVDAVVVVENPAENHMQTAGTVYSPYLSNEVRAPLSAGTAVATVLEAQDIISRRAAMELRPGMIVNLGIGIPASVGAVAKQEGIFDDLTLTVEVGIFGGVPSGFPDFGSATNAEAIISMPSMFDYYHGGGLDITFLGAAQIDKSGNVNASKFGSRISGTGGFIDISQSTPKVVFCTFFTAKGLEQEVVGGKLVIRKEGEIHKFLDRVDHITFSGETAVRKNQEVLIITERGVFELTAEGLVLTEIAPGIDLEKDILNQMRFKPIISSSLKIMDERIFRPGLIHCFKDFESKVTVI